MKYLLDTNVISELSNPRPSSKVWNWIQLHEGNCMIPSIAIAERFQGAYSQDEYSTQEDRLPPSAKELSAAPKSAVISP